jgi:hypothetical protein
MTKESMRLRRNNGQVDYRKEKENYNNKLPLMATMAMTEMILYWNGKFLIDCISN